MDVNGDLYSYLRGAREALLWKLEGLGEYDMRRPMTPTGTNLLGLVKHSARSHLMYFCDVFRPATGPVTPLALGRGSRVRHVGKARRAHGRH